MHWHQTAAPTSQTWIISQLTSNSHASLWSNPINEKWHTVLWQRECEQSIHVQQPHRMRLGEKVLALVSARPRSRLFSEHVRYMSWCVRLSVVCLSSVTFVHPTQAIEIFGNVSTPFGTLAICDPSLKILRRSSQGNPSVGGGG